MWHPRLLLEAHVYPWMIDEFSPNELAELVREMNRRDQSG